jgi:preprotein translocase subunit SecA
LWRITEVRHDAAPTAAPPPPTDEAARSSEAAANNGSAVDRAIEPIRNYGKRVGRNDPCPCGSGKKYKNCCMP